MVNIFYPTDSGYKCLLANDDWMSLKKKPVMSREGRAPNAARLAAHASEAGRLLQALKEVQKEEPPMGATRIANFCTKPWAQRAKLKVAHPFLYRTRIVGRKGECPFQELRKELLIGAAEVLENKIPKIFAGFEEYAQSKIRGLDAADDNMYFRAALRFLDGNPDKLLQKIRLISRYFKLVGIGGYPRPAVNWGIQSSPYSIKNAELFERVCRRAERYSNLDAMRLFIQTKIVTFKVGEKKVNVGTKMVPVPMNQGMRPEPILATHDVMSGYEEKYLRFRQKHPIRTFLSAMAMLVPVFWMAAYVHGMPPPQRLIDEGQRAELVRNYNSPEICLEYDRYKIIEALEQLQCAELTWRRENR